MVVLLLFFWWNSMLFSLVAISVCILGRLLESEKVGQGKPFLVPLSWCLELRCDGRSSSSHFGILKMKPDGHLLYLVHWFKCYLIGNTLTDIFRITFNQIPGNLMAHLSCHRVNQQRSNDAFIALLNSLSEMPQLYVFCVLRVLKKSVKLCFGKIAEMPKLLPPWPGGVQLASGLYDMYRFWKINYFIW